MPNTPLGFRYPQPSDGTALWTYFQNLATDLDTYLTGEVVPGAWQNLLLPHAGWGIPTGTDSGGNARVAQVRQVGPALQLQGFLTHATFNSFAAAWRLPTSVPFPTRERTVTVATPNADITRSATFQADGSGDIWVFSATGSAAFFCLDGIIIPLGL
ncbi:hypothetical protein [uncultured Jatrophihabitans sp.]|uniref:hypothetical protein n=1 Tax=uncultured Jatrophihabitans sp. TaxID=1610747 RepID=UPI0035CC3273